MHQKGAACAADNREQKCTYLELQTTPHVCIGLSSGLYGRSCPKYYKCVDLYTVYVYIHTHACMRACVSVGGVCLGVCGGVLCA